MGEIHVIFLSADTQYDYATNIIAFMSSIQKLSLKARNLIVHFATGKIYWKEPETLKPNIFTQAI